MTDPSIKLSAYLDGELDPSEAAAIEAELETNAEMQAELDALIQADVMAQEQFEEQLNGPIPLPLVRQIKATPLQTHAQTARPAQSNSLWKTLAASLVVFSLGGAGGYLINEQTTPTQTARIQPNAGWLNAVADYHAVYASQGRHLVEVGADESDHIETWLGQTIGAEFSIPNLSDFGLTFEGGRLLVANGKPVAQLMYTQADGSVLALCLQRGNADGTNASSFQEQTINDFDFVSWSEDGVNYVVIGPNGQPDLNTIATTAALQV